MRGYLGDSRGHWEGDTLVIETTNFNGKATTPGNNVLASTELTIVERITRVEPDLLRYEATITDPKTYTRPYTISIPYTSQRAIRCFRTSVTKATSRSFRVSAASAPRTRRSKRTPSAESCGRGGRFRAA